MAAKRKRAVTEAEDAIKIMGGPTKVGRWWGISHSTVCGMAQDGRLSGKYGLRTYFYLTHLGYAPAPQLFGLKSWKQLYPPGANGDGRKRRTG